MPQPENQKTALNQLASLLRLRASIVSDSALRTGNPDEHLRQLKKVSEELFELHRNSAPSLSPRLNHFLDNGSYAKALEHVATLLD